MRLFRDPARPTYLNVQNALFDAIEADPRWRQWWAASAGAAELELYPWYSGRPTQPVRIRRGKRVVRAEFDLGDVTCRSTGRQFLWAQAVADVRWMLDQVRSALKLPELPDLPILPPPPPTVDMTTPDPGYRNDELSLPIPDHEWDGWERLNVRPADDR